MDGIRERLLVRNKQREPLLRKSLVGIAIAVGVILGSVFALFFPDGFLVPDSHPSYTFPSDVQILSGGSESSERIESLKSELAAATETNAQMKKKISEMTLSIQLLEQCKDYAEKHVLFLGKHVRGSRMSPYIGRDESVNPRLAKILEEVGIQRELIVALGNSNVKDMLEIWFTSIKKAGISNYLVFALDYETFEFCNSNNIPVYMRDPDEEFDSIARTGFHHAISGLKFRALREFLLLGYSILVSDVDVVYLQNPFNHLYRDSDVEFMTTGFDNETAYGYSDTVDDPVMGWGRYADTLRIWGYNPGFFYIRPTVPSVEFLDRVASRLLLEEKSLDQTVLNEELFFPSHPGYDGLHISRRTLDFHLFMNSKFLFKTLRKDASLSKFKPVIVHVNYHPDKLPRMKAIMDFYFNGKTDALDPFPDGSDWAYENAPVSLKPKAAKDMESSGETQNLTSVEVKEASSEVSKPTVTENASSVLKLERAEDSESVGHGTSGLSVEVNEVDEASSYKETKLQEISKPRVVENGLGLQKLEGAEDLGSLDETQYLTSKLSVEADKVDETPSYTKIELQEISEFMQGPKARRSSAKKLENKRTNDEDDDSDEDKERAGADYSMRRKAGIPINKRAKRSTDGIKKKKVSDRFRK